MNSEQREERKLEAKNKKDQPVFEMCAERILP